MKVPKKKFSYFLFIYGTIVFILSFLFNYWANAIVNPQVLSAKPYFHIITSLPFAFEMSLFFSGLLVFIRFVLVTRYNTQNSYLSNNISKSEQNENLS
ncbi:MAG: DUF3341 domain-containing protein [Ignavibacteria bacterium]|nr:DUF3341 domain-containing protein [Ignavibacteria bacterium]